MSTSVLIIAGEASGDLHGAALVKELKKLNSEISFFGIGGSRMKEAGLELIYHLIECLFLDLLKL